ncbi:hypothetical protein H4I96_04012 [Botrytis cinerea]
MTGAPQESSVITTMATENKDQSATASLQPPAPSTGPAMSNTTPMTSTAAIILPPVGMGRVLFPELSLMLFHQLLSMTLAGLPPPLVCAFHGSPCYPTFMPNTNPSTLSFLMLQCLFSEPLPSEEANWRRFAIYKYALTISA